MKAFVAYDKTVDGCLIKICCVEYDQKKKKSKNTTLLHYGKVDLVAYDETAVYKQAILDAQYLNENKDIIQQLKSNSKSRKRKNYVESLESYLRSLSNENTYDRFEEIYSYDFSQAVFYSIWKELNLHKFFNNRQNNIPSLPYNINEACFFLTVERLMRPKSKNMDFNMIEDSIFDNTLANMNLADCYKILEYLSERKQEIVNALNIGYETKNKRVLNVAFYDVTTFRFESFEIDELRVNGMSKDNKFAETQVVYGMIMDIDGIPFDFHVFPGNMPEIDTLIEVIEESKLAMEAKKVRVIADAGLSQLCNLYKLDEKGYEYIITYKPKAKLTDDEKTEFLKDEGWIRLGDGSKYKEMKKDLRETRFKTRNNNGPKTKKFGKILRYIGMYSAKRREHELFQLEKSRIKILKKMENNPYDCINSSKKTSLVKIEGAKVSFNTRLYEEKKLWAGYTGIITNINVDAEKAVNLIKIRKQLWKIEENFRIMKTSLKSRPVFVRKISHIIGHFIICYMALFVGKVLLKRLKEKGHPYSLSSVQQAFNAASICIEKNPNNEYGIEYSYSCHRRYISTKRSKNVVREYTGVVIEKIMEVLKLKPLNKRESYSDLKKKLGNSFDIKRR